MTDDDCGCRCRECREQDIHRCARPECGYTKALAITRPLEHPKPIEVPEFLRAQFKSIRDPASKGRLGEWFQFCQETAELEFEIREAKRRERHAEIFGGI